MHHEFLQQRALVTGMQVEGFYGNAPARVPAARTTYIPNEGASGADTFDFFASDGDLRSEHTVQKFCR